MEHIHQLIPGSRFEVFEHSSHLQMYEERERYMKVMNDCSTKSDPPEPTPERWLRIAFHTSQPAWGMLPELIKEELATEGEP